MNRPMLLTKRNNQELDFPEWFHEAMCENKIISHGMGKFGEGKVYLETFNKNGERIVVGEGDIFMPDSDKMTFDIVKRRKPS